MWNGQTDGQWDTIIRPDFMCRCHEWMYMMQHFISSLLLKVTFADCFACFDCFYTPVFKTGRIMVYHCPSVCPFHMSCSNLRTPWPIHFKFHRVIGIDGLTVCILYGEILNFHSMSPLKAVKIWNVASYTFIHEIYTWWKVGHFHWLSRYNWNIVESGIKHHNLPLPPSHFTHLIHYMKFFIYIIIIWIPLKNCTTCTTQSVIIIS
jgi:hypothetical protein